MTAEKRTDQELTGFAVGDVVGLKSDPKIRMTVVGYFTPLEWQELDNGLLDFGQQPIKSKKIYVRCSWLNSQRKLESSNFEPGTLQKIP